MALKTLTALAPASILLVCSAVSFFKERTFSSFLQLFSAGCLVVMVFTHIFEAFRAFPSMHFGREHSVGHYLDLASALLGLTLFSVGYLFHALAKQ